MIVMSSNLDYEDTDFEDDFDDDFEDDTG